MRGPAAALAVAAALPVATAGCGGGGSGSGGTAPAVALGRGGRLFVKKCGACHTLAAAGTNGTVGPRLDVLRPDAATVLVAIENGPGVMPADLVTAADARAVADYVARHAGR